MPADRDDAACTVAGVQKAPRHEIAGSGAPAVPRALRRFSRGRRVYCLEGMHYFGVMAQGLLTGESRFLCLCDFKELGVAKQSRSTTYARSALRQPWSIIAPTNFLKAATNLNVVQPKLFQASR